MSYRRFEMYEIRQAIQRLRSQESARQVASALKLGRTTVNTIRTTALAQGWLSPSAVVPDDATLATFFKQSRTGPQNVSSVELYRAEILKWHGQNINATTIRRALVSDWRTHLVYIVALPDIDGHEYRNNSQTGGHRPTHRTNQAALHTRVKGSDRQAL